MLLQFYYDGELVREIEFKQNPTLEDCDSISPYYRCNEEQYKILLEKGESMLDNWANVFLRIVKNGA